MNEARGGGWAGPNERQEKIQTPGQGQNGAKKV